MFIINADTNVERIETQLDYIRFRVSITLEIIPAKNSQGFLDASPRELHALADQAVSLFTDKAKQKGGAK